MLLLFMVYIGAPHSRAHSLAHSRQLLDTFSCSKTRYTGYNDHRTLHIPAAIWDAAEKSTDAIAWANTLCCTFTWAVRDADTTYPYMVTYDGGRRFYSGTTEFVKVAKLAYGGICAMYMGSQDCKSCPAPIAFTGTSSPARPPTHTLLLLDTCICTWTNSHKYMHIQVQTVHT